MWASDHVPTKSEIVMRRGCDWVDGLDVPDDDPLPDGTTVIFYAYPRDSNDVLAFWPAASVLPGGARFQIYADDHEIIPDGAKYTVILQKPGYPKTPWVEGRISKVNR